MSHRFKYSLLLLCLFVPFWNGIFSHRVRIFVAFPGKSWGVVPNWVLCLWMIFVFLRNSQDAAASPSRPRVSSAIRCFGIPIASPIISFYREIEISARRANLSLFPIEAYPEGGARKDLVRFKRQNSSWGRSPKDRCVFNSTWEARSDLSLRSRHVFVAFATKTS